MKKYFFMILFGLLFTRAFAKDISENKNAVANPALGFISEWIKTYSSQGYHRAGSPEDQNSALWLKSILDVYKVPVTLETFSFVRPVSGGANIVLHTKPHEKEYPGMPLLNAAATGGAGYSGRLGTIHENEDAPVIYRFELMPNEEVNNEFLVHNHSELEKMLVSDNYPAIIVITQGDRVGLAPFDIDLSHSFSKPVMLVSSYYGEELEMLTHINMSFELVTRVKHETTNGYNVVAKIEGTDTNLKPLVVMVNRSTWWKGAGERGTGLATWLYTVKTIRAQHPRRTVYFLALTGHELGDLGLKDFVKIHPDLIQDVKAWIILGPNIAAASDSQYGIFATDDALKNSVEEIFSRYQINNLIPLAQIQDASLKDILQSHDVPFIDFEGMKNRCYHLECDKWPAAINMKSESRFSQTFAGWISGLTQ